MSTYGIDALKEAVASVAAYRVGKVYEMGIRKGYTPIEALFIASFIAGSHNSEFSQWPFLWAEDRESEEKAMARMATAEDGAIYVFPQCQMLDWRVDFLIGMKRGEQAKWVIVECDGHDFHERTKEQAAKDRARDRAYQACGYGVFRFTGSELHREPYEKAGEVFEVLVNWYFG